MAPMAQPIHRPRKTVEDYLALPDDVRAELIDGELYVTPSPRLRHQDVAGRIYSALLNWAESTGAGAAYIAPLDVYLPTGDIVQPDVLLIRTENLGIARDWVRGAPNLVVEVLSRSGPMRDRIVKRELYARNGAPAYWIVDPEERAIEVLALVGTAYVPEAYFTGTHLLISQGLPGLRIPLPMVFR